MERRRYGEGTIRLHQNGMWEGRLIVRSKGYKPIFKYAYEKSYEECEQKIKELKIEHCVIDNEMFSPDMLFKDWIEIWLTYTSSKRTDSTNKSYRNMLDNHILPILGDKQINKITTGVLERYYADLLKNGRLISRHLYGEGLSSNMVRTIHKLISSIFNTAIDNSFLKRNPASRARIPIQHVSSKKIFSYDEIRRILIVAKKYNMYELFLMALCTGMERGELCALRWKDITFSKKQVRITKTIKIYRKEYILEPVKKRSQMRNLVLSDRLIQVLKNYKKMAKTEWVFASLNHKGEKPKNPELITVSFKKILKEAGIQEGTFKSLKDTYAVLCLDNGMDIRTLASVLGFDNVQTIKTSYIPYMTTKKVVAANKMEGAMTSIKTLYG